MTSSTADTDDLFATSFEAAAASFAPEEEDNNNDPATTTYSLDVAANLPREY